MSLLELRDGSLYCPAGDFYIDPGMPVARAVITHSHSDHARAGSAAYLTAQAGAALLRARIGDEGTLQTIEYGERVTLGGVQVSLHPAGHILGSAQVRIEARGEVWVVSGDYKLEADPTCAPFEALRCHTFVTESTFGLPVFRWPALEQVLADVAQWWRGNRDAGKASVLFAYPLGKAQRLLAGLPEGIGPVYTHGAVERLTAIYREAGVRMLESQAVPDSGVKRGALIVAPPLAVGSPWMRRFGKASTALASGWMRIRGTRRRRALDRGFALSDHADWPGLLRAIEATGAENVWVAHGYRDPLARWLREHGRNAEAVAVRYGDEHQPTSAESGELAEDD